MTRILVTGARDWEDRRSVELALSIAIAGTVGEVKIVHGACPYGGADKFADDFARKHPRCEPEAHPADWLHCDDTCYHKPRRLVTGENNCPAAGPRRNQKMVDLGADVCLAFPLGESKGTRDCMRRAKAAGIQVFNYGDEYLL